MDLSAIGSAVGIVGFVYMFFRNFKTDMNKKFDAVNEKFDAVNEKFAITEKKFDKIEVKIDRLDEKINDIHGRVNKIEGYLAGNPFELRIKEK